VKCAEFKEQTADKTDSADDLLMGRDNVPCCAGSVREAMAAAAGTSMADRYVDVGCVTLTGAEWRQLRHGLFAMSCNEASQVTAEDDPFLIASFSNEMSSGVSVSERSKRGSSQEFRQRTGVIIGSGRRGRERCCVRLCLYLCLYSCLLLCWSSLSCNG
jgi:hypothetical protein